MDFNTCKGAPLHGGATLAVSAVSILSKFHKNPNNEKPKYQKFKILRTSKISLSLNWHLGECSEHGAAMTEAVCDPVRIILFII